ncbi:MAG TPA: ABC transporter substrate-binding protein [Bryobacteraceae bacterium]|nr:ABC transporter substrate-binding protein [Bryobacteraceae bacterium]
MKILAGLAAACVLAQAPYKDARTTPPEYEGPGREEQAPADLTEIRIGFFGPTEDTIWQGAALAVEEANRRGGYRGFPFRLVSRWSDDPWRAGAAHVVRLAYEDQVWAIIGGIDGATTHLAEQVVVKARLALVSPASTDRSVSQAGVPWMFTRMPEDDLLAGVLARALAGERNLTLVSATDHDSRAFSGELRKAMGGLGIVPAFHFEFDAGQGAEAAAARARDASAVVLIAGPDDSARFLRALRTPGFGGRVYAAHWVARRGALEEAEGVVFPYPLESPRAGFPDYAAAYAYDATTMVVEAVRKGGLNRVKIYDAIRAASLARNLPPVRIATVRGGRVVPVALP